MRNLTFILISILLFLTSSCQSNKDYDLSELLTDSSSKYWIVNSINGRNIETAKTRIVWKFDINNNYLDYRFENGNLALSENGDELYSNKYEIPSKKEIKLNGYSYKLDKLTRDSLIVSNKNKTYILVYFNLN